MRFSYSAFSQSLSVSQAFVIQFDGLMPSQDCALNHLFALSPPCVAAPIVTRAVITGVLVNTILIVL